MVVIGQQEHVIDEMGNRVIVDHDIHVQWDKVDQIKQYKKELRNRFGSKTNSASPTKSTSKPRWNELQNSWKGAD